VVANGRLAEETDLAGGRRLTRWVTDAPLPTKVMVVGVARFAVRHPGRVDDVPLSTWVYPQDRETGFEVFDDPTPAVLDFYDARIGPYAYEKLANIQAHSLGGGMESASAIFYGEESATGARPVRWRNVIIHEIAHQWWGNAVTESDWDDVWLSEGFATYFTLLFREHAYGRDDFVEGLLESRERVLAFDAEYPDYRIVHDDLADMGRVTTGQTYQKGAWVLHMLRGLLGDEEFWQGIAGYYARYQNANATTDDFRREMEEASGRRLGWFFEQWLTRGSHPVVSGTWEIVDGAVELRLRQERPGEPFRLPMTVALRTASGEERREPVVLEGATGTFRLDVDGEVAEVVLDPDHWVLMRAEVRRR
ncbi:MAG: M1 family aminopeptidase, partial [Acidobacteriota bacterium]